MCVNSLESLEDIKKSKSTANDPTPITTTPHCTSHFTNRRYCILLHHCHPKPSKPTSTPRCAAPLPQRWVRDISGVLEDLREGKLPAHERRKLVCAR
jgi:hypothetical protein